MATLSVPERPDIDVVETVADLLHRLGDIPPNRVLLDPRPGSATEKDVIAAREGKQRLLCELVDGTLVEKAMGFKESLLACYFIGLFHEFNKQRNLGLITGADGMVRLFPGLVRIPDVAFALWRNIEGGRVPTQPIPDLVPNLIIEVLSVSNTRAEMTRKRKEYFKAGAQLVWMVDPETRTVTVHTVDGHVQTLGEDAVLTGGVVLPEFSVAVRDIFAELDRHQP